MRANYKILSDKIEAFDKVIAKLNKVCFKLGLPNIKVSMSHSHYQAYAVRKVNQQEGGWYDIDSISDQFEDTGVRREFINVEIEGEAPKYNGWTFVATLSPIPTDDGIFNQIRSIPGNTITIPNDYKTRVGDCDHCGYNRRRNETFVVAHENGDIKMVGSSCIKDFLGHSNPHNIGAFFELLFSFDSFIGSDGDYYGGDSIAREYSLLKFLEVAAAIIDKYGWLAKSKAKPDEVSTACRLSQYFLGVKNTDNSSKIVVTDENKILASSTLNWLKSLNDSENDYLYNLFLIGKCQHITVKSFGLAASAISAYLRANAPKPINRGINSKYIGNIKDKIDIEVDVTSIRCVLGSFGLTNIHTMYDDNDNCYIWFCTGKPLEFGRQRIKGTIKAHSEYNGIKQTTLNRVKAIC